MSSGTDRHRTPVASTRATASASVRSTSQPSRDVGEQPGDGCCRGLDADGAQACVGHAANGCAADDRRQTDDRGRGRRDAPRGSPPPPGSGRCSRPGWTAAGARCRPQRWRRGRRAPAWRSRRRPRRCVRAGTAACSRTHHSWKWIARGSGLGDDDVRLDPVVGHRQQANARAASGRRAPRSLAESG